VHKLISDGVKILALLRYPSSEQSTYHAPPQHLKDDLKHTVMRAEKTAETFIIGGRLWIKAVPKKNKIVLQSATIYILMLPFA
jgi:hypothetical protein